MAGYGGLGGLGGFSFPTRRGMGDAAPGSAPVQSDQEFNMGWEQQLANTPRYLTANAFEDAPYRQQGDAALRTEWLQGATGAEADARNALYDEARKYGLAPIAGPQANGGTFGVGYNPYDAGAGRVEATAGGASHLVNLGSNPEWERMRGQWDTAAQQRSENQTRQQQAYDTTMMGNGATGGVMPSNYTDANFGQVTGQKSGGLGGLGGADLTGVDQAQQTGAYMGGSGSYNPNPFSAGNFKSQNPWGGF
jgi:hypothetical protein